jgi:hypothetical protein
MSAVKEQSTELDPKSGGMMLILAKLERIHELAGRPWSEVMTEAELAEDCEVISDHALRTRGKESGPQFWHDREAFYCPKGYGAVREIRSLTFGRIAGVYLAHN